MRRMTVKPGVAGADDGGGIPVGAPKSQNVTIVLAGDPWSMAIF
jgi:hypothetical protein